MTGIDETYYVGNYTGVPGLVWYADAKQVRGDELKLGDWLDSLDHRGARAILGMWLGDAAAETEELHNLDFHLGESIRTVMFSGGETETLHGEVLYDVVDPDSQVAPDGTPLWTYDRHDNPVLVRDYDYDTDYPEGGPR